METKRCPHCGETLPIASTFCPACFKELVVEPADSVIVSKKRPMFFLWLGILAIVVLFFTLLLVFSRNDQKSNGIPATFTPSPATKDTTSVNSLVPEVTLDTTVPSTVNATTQFIESVTPSFPLQTPTLSTSVTATETVSAATPGTASTPTKIVTVTGQKTPSATVPSTTIARTPTQPRATATATKATSTITKTPKPTVTVKPTTTVKPTNTVTDEQWFEYTVSNGVATITDYYGPDTILYIPSTLGGYPVTGIGDAAFNLATMKEAYIPNGVTYIGESAFSVCLFLEKIYIADTVTEIKQHAFANCPKLYDVRLSNNLVIIYHFAFSECPNLKTLDLPSKLETICSGVFMNSGLTRLDIPASVTEMHQACYFATSLEHIEVDPDNPMYFSIDGVLFFGDMLIAYPANRKDDNYIIPSFVTSIYAQAFYGCKNVTLTVAEGSYAHNFAEENNIPYKLK